MTRDMLGMDEMRELELIERIRRAAPKHRLGVALGIGDDCAILRPPRGHELLVTTDLSLEGRHFRRNWHPPDAVGHRVLARGLSDLAAMGARPTAAFLSLALPGELLKTGTGKRPSRGIQWIDQFLFGFHRLADSFSVQLAGGDTAESPGDFILADVVLVGSAPRGRSLRRSGGSPGDFLYVTGQLGGSAAELGELGRERAVRRFASEDHPHLYPMPRVKVGQQLLARKLATAAIDLSDGLSTDLAHICVRSGTGAEIWQDKLPVHPTANLDQALHGGEDYELLFCARPAVKIPRRISGVPIACIGKLVRGTSVRLVADDGTIQFMEPRGWEHFRSGVSKKN